MADRSIFVDFELGGDGTTNCLAVFDKDQNSDDESNNREKGKALRKRVSFQKQDAVTWKAKTGNAVKVEFVSAASSPFTVQSGQGNPLKLTVRDSAGTGRYKYTLTLLDNTSNILASEDPQIIVDDSFPLGVGPAAGTSLHTVSINAPVTISG